VYDGLRRRAAEQGVTVPELLRAGATRIAARPSSETCLASTRRHSSAIGDDVETWPATRVDHRPLLRRAWHLRGSLTAADALYVALAEALDATLLTLDRRLARADGPRCEIAVPDSP